MRRQPAQNRRPGRRGSRGSHTKIMTNCSTRVEMNNYKASYLRSDERCRDVGNRDHVARAFAEPAKYGQCWHHRMAFQRADVLCWTVRDVLHRARAGRRQLAAAADRTEPVQAVPVTLVLIASSFTCQMGVFAAERGDVFGLRRWYVITFLMGLFFVARSGLRVHPSRRARHDHSRQRLRLGVLPATGFHGLHVIGGLIAFIFLLARTSMTKFTPAQATAAIVVSYYWHFVDIVWIALFATIYFVRLAACR